MKVLTAYQNILNADQQYINLINDVTFQPIFILGDHRSGTPVLYQLLNATKRFNVVTSYHLIKYSEILYNHVNRTERSAKNKLAEHFSTCGLTDRIIDGVEVTPDLPEEYGFMLKHVRLRVQLNDKNLPAFIELCKKVQFVSDPGKPLLLKNPWDILNFMYVKKVFPMAKFIFIHRNQINVINSQLQAIRSLFREENKYTSLLADWYRQIFNKPFQLYCIRLLFSSHLEMGFKIVSRHAALVADYFLENVGLLSEKDYICIRYEDLCEEPRSTITTILSFLGIPECTDIEYKLFIQKRQTNLLDEVQKNKWYLMKKLKPYFDYCNYTLEEEAACGGSLTKLTG